MPPWPSSCCGLVSVLLVDGQLRIHILAWLLCCSLHLSQPGKELEAPTQRLHQLAHGSTAAIANRAVRWKEVHLTFLVPGLRQALYHITHFHRQGWIFQHFLYLLLNTPLIWILLFLSTAFLSLEVLILKKSIYMNSLCSSDIKLFLQHLLWNSLSNIHLLLWLLLYRRCVLWM